MVQGTQRTEVHYSGRVQGVGFRYTTRQIAGRFAVTGFVRNLSDGRVHLVVEGGEAEVSLFLSEIASTFAHHIAEADLEHLAATGEFSGFDVRF